ncbi:MAG: GNAT family N-acetyltransferase [Planctomycetes bacterium]|nr:GNAT family N-acetyltransferase [Planctomycetota bacterium]
MNDASGIEVRPARRTDAGPLAVFLEGALPSPAAAEGAPAFPESAVSDCVLAARGDEIIGSCRFMSSPGRCAVVMPPRLPEWDAALAARLLRAAAAQVHARDGARLIQVLVEPDGSGPLADALRRAGFATLAVLAYLRRAVLPEERHLPLPAGIAWRHYWRLRRGQFARTIAATYEQSLDCAGLAGLRTVDDAIATHRATGRFCPRAWSLAVVDGEPAGVVLLNNLQGRGEVAYLGVVPSSRRRGLGEVLVCRAVRDTAAMNLPQIGLAVDVSNTAAMRLYEKTGFREIRRRTAYFIPAARLEELGTL